MTAHAFKEERERCLSNGMNDYVMKPFDPDDLFAKICKYAGIDFKGDTNNESDKKPMGIPGRFDIRLLADACAGDLSELKKIIDVYSSSVPGDISELATASRNGNNEQVRMKRHSLQTTFGYLGMSTAATLLKKTADSEADVPQLAEQIAKEWQQTIPMIKEFVEEL